MIKFFRKYNKQILAIVTVLLMISFIGGFALQSLMTPSPFREVRAEAFGTPITQGDLNAVRTETRVLDGLGVPWRTPWGFDGSMPPLNELEYLLLMQEARRADLRPSLDQARVQLGAANRNLTKFLLDNAISSETLEQAYANYVGVQHAWELARQSMLPSEMEVQQAVRNQHETLNAGIVQIGSQPLIDPQQAVDNDALAQHFEKYKDSLPSNEPLSFGYLVPDQVRVEYVKIQTSDIALNQPVTVSQAERYWRDHQKEFLRPKDEAADDADPDRPAYYEAFADAQGDVVARLTGQARLAEAREMAGIVWNALREPWYNATDDGQGFLLAPEVAKQAGYYQEVIERAKDRLEHPGTLTTGQTGLFSGRQAGEQAQIGQSREDTQGGAPGDAFGSTTHQVQGLVAEAPPGARFLSLYQTAPVWTIDDDDNLYIYRVVKVRKSRPPESLAEVRDQVESDVRALEAFERSAEHARRVLQLAGEGGGLQAAWEAYDGLDPEVKSEVGGWFEAKPFPREMPELLPGLRFPVSVTDKDGARDDDGRLKYQIRSDEFVARVYALQESDGGEALGLIEVPGSGNCFVVQLAGLNHITTEDYPRFKTNILRAIGRSREDRLKREWFSGERIRARAGFKASTPS